MKKIGRIRKVVFVFIFLISVFGLTACPDAVYEFDKYELEELKESEFQKGYQWGYDDGIEDGYNDGYQSGYNDGLNENSETVAKNDFQKPHSEFKDPYNLTLGEINTVLYSELYVAEPKYNSSIRQIMYSEDYELLFIQFKSEDVFMFYDAHLRDYTFLAHSENPDKYYNNTIRTKYSIDDLGKMKIPEYGAVNNYTSGGTPIQEDENYLREIISTMDVFDITRSTAISRIGYSEVYEILLITFLESGASYLYYDVPYREFYDLYNADSIGRYFNQNIKGYYDVEKIY